MTYRKVAKWPNRSVLGVCSPVEDFGDDLKSLVVDMIDTCNVDNGVGLAANQIEVSKRVVVIKPSAFGYENGDPCEINEDFLVLINPELKNSGEVNHWREACLSLPGIEGRVERHTETHVLYYDMEGDERELIAEWPLSGGIQHECDHLDGKLFISKMSRCARSIVLNRYRKLEKRQMREARKELRELQKPRKMKTKRKRRR